MTDLRTLLAHDPMTFNELLDLFDAYVSSIGGPIKKSHEMLRETIGMGENTALGHIFGVACDAEDMANRLRHIRAARNTGTDVTVTLTQIEYRQIDTAIPDMIDLLEDTANTLDMLSSGLDGGSIAPDQYALSATLRLLGRALRHADQVEVPALMITDRKIRDAVGSLLEAKREKALQMGEAT